MSVVTTTGHQRIISFPELQWHPHRRRMLTLAMLGTVQEADTNGWDTVFAIPIAEVNKAIVNKKSSPASFQVSDPDDPDTKADGTFGDWQITPKGDGRYLHFDVPIKTGTGFCMKAYPLDDTIINIRVQLDYLPANTADQQDLKVKATPADNDDPIVVVNSMIFPAGKEPKLTPKAVLIGLMQEWFNSNLQAFNHVFASVMINQATAIGAFAFLKPNEIGYANVKIDDTHGIFGVLATTATRSKAGLPYTIATSAIPVGAASGFLISSERFLDDLVKPALHDVFNNVTADDFELTTNAVLRNKKDITMPVDTGKETKTGAIKAHGMTLAIKGTRLILEIPKLSVNISPGIDVEIDLHEELEVSVKRKNDGTNTLWFEQIPNDSSVTHQVIFADWVTGVEIAADIIAGILLSVIGFKGAGKFVAMGMSKIAARVVMGIILFALGAIVGTITNIPKFIALANDHQYDQLPSLEKLLVEGLNTIQWPNSSGFSLNSAGLSKSFQLGIDLKFID